MIRLVTIAVGAAAVAFALLARGFRNPVGLLQANACLPLAVGVACAIVAFLPRRTFGRAGLWLGLAAVGEGALLQLTRAGTAVGYQHLMTPTDWRATEAWPLALLMIQLVFVCFAGRDLPVRVWRWARAAIPAWRIWTIIGLFALTAATLSADPSVYVVELVVATLAQGLMLLTVVLSARALPESGLARVRQVADRVLGDSAGPSLSGPVRPDRFAWLSAIWVFAITAALSIGVYGSIPHLGDEVAYLFHARYFSIGRLWLDSPPVLEAFRIGLVAFGDGIWYSPVPPAWPAALAIGVKLGAPHLVNPILAAGNVLLAYGLFSHFYRRRTARVATLLLAFSPWFLFLGMSFMTHMFSMLLALAATWWVARFRLGSGVRWAALGGVGIGLVGLTRPLEGVILAGLLGIWALASRTGRLPKRATGVAVMAVVSLGLAAMTFPYNRVITGDPLVFPINEYVEDLYGVGTNDLGFGPDRGFDSWRGLDPLPGHGPLDVLINGNLNLHGVNVELLGWATGSLLIVLIGALAARRNRVDIAMAIVAAAVIGAHSLYWFSGGPDFGARYWFMALFPFLALAARGLDAIGDSLRAHGGPTRVRFAAAGLAFLAITVFVPWRSIDKYRDYRGMRPDMRRLAAESDFGRGLVLIRGREYPDYVGAALLNPLDLSDPEPVYAHDKSLEVRRRVIEAFPDRPIWIVEGPARTGGGYTVVAGPLPPAVVPGADQ